MDPSAKACSRRDRPLRGRPVSDPRVNVRFLRFSPENGRAAFGQSRPFWSQVRMSAVGRVPAEIVPEVEQFVKLKKMSGSESPE
jgi:hypothetical protein